MKLRFMLPAALALLQRKSGAQVGVNASLLDVIIEQQSPGSRRRRATTGSLLDARRPAGGDPQLSLLEGHLRHAILDPGARERLVNAEMRRTGGTRAAAIREVLRALEHDNR
jgi:hypothetical protein